MYLENGHGVRQSKHRKRNITLRVVATFHSKDGFKLSTKLFILNDINTQWTNRLSFTNTKPKPSLSTSFHDLDMHALLAVTMQIYHFKYKESSKSIGFLDEAQKPKYMRIHKHNIRNKVSWMKHRELTDIIPASLTRFRISAPEYPTVRKTTCRDGEKNMN